MKIQRLKGMPLFGRIKSLQRLAHPRAVVDEGLDLRYVLANGIELSLQLGMLGEQALTTFVNLGPISFEGRVPPACG